MKLLLRISLALITLPAFAGSADHSPRLYYNRFHKELSNLQERIMDYYTANLLDADEKEIEKALNKVIRQIELGRSHVKAAPVFKGDASFRDNYLNGLDSLLLVFESEFAEAQKLRRYRHQSTQDLMAYYKAVDQAEKSAARNEAYLQKIEQRFANKYSIRIERDDQRETDYENFTSIYSHYKELTLQFSKVEHSVENYFEIIKSHPNANLENVGLANQLEKINIQIEESLTILKGIENDSELDKSLLNDLTSYLKLLKKQSRKNLKGITHTLETKPFYTNDFRDAKIDLEFVTESYTAQRQKFVDSQQVWIQKSLSQLSDS